MANIKQLIFACLVALMIASSSGQKVFPGTCPSNVSGIKDFDASKYVGLWYEIEKYPFIFEDGGKCITAQYEPIDANSIKVINSQINIATGKKSSAEAVATIVRPGELRVQFAGMPAFSNQPNYVVISTDYTQYAVVYSCTDLLAINAKVIWILARERHPDPEVVKKARQAIVDHGLSLKELTQTDQDNCPE